MKIGTVTGTVSAARRADCLQGCTFLAVQTREEHLIAADLVGAAAGDLVLLVSGAAAGRCCMDAPVDAAAVAIVDPQAAPGCPEKEKC